MSWIYRLSRLIHDAVEDIYNTIHDRTVDVYVQTSPGRPSGDTRGVGDLDFRVTSRGAEIRRDTAGADGKITVLVRGGRSTLELLHQDNPVAEYEITATSAALAAVTDVEGQKQRLRLLGYHLGHGGTQGNGVDTNDDAGLRRALLDFQLDQGLAQSGTANSATRNTLTSEAGG